MTGERGQKIQNAISKNVYIPIWTQDMEFRDEHWQFMAKFNFGQKLTCAPNAWISFMWYFTLRHNLQVGCELSVNTYNFEKNKGNSKYQLKNVQLSIQNYTYIKVFDNSLNLFAWIKVVLATPFVS